MKDYGILREIAASPVTTPTEPVSMMEVKAHLRIDRNDEDDDIERLITAARTVAEARRAEDLVNKSYRLTLDAFRDPDIYLRKWLSTVTLFRYRGTTGTWTNLSQNTHYIVDTERGLVTYPDGGSWPGDALYPTSGVQIEFTVVPTVDEMVKQGILMLIRHWYDNDVPVANIGTLMMEYPYAVSALLDWGREALIV